MIKDVSQVELVARVDDRGYLVEILRATDPHFTQFGQVYLVGNLGRGTIRAFHKHDELWDWFFISHGTAKFVLVDDRKNSPTYKEQNTFVIGSRNPSLLVVPPDGRFLLFVSDRDEKGAPVKADGSENSDIYWVSTEIIEGLRAGG